MSGSKLSNTSASSFHFWLRGETKPNERRTMLLPEHVEALLKAGHRVTVEKWEDRCVKDEDYAKIAHVVMAVAGSWPLAPKDAIILGLKELPRRPYLLEHQHVHFAHCFKRQRGWEKVLMRYAEGTGTLWDLEFLRSVQDYESMDMVTLAKQPGQRALAFGVAAGYVGAALGLLDWACLRLKTTLEATPARTFDELAKRCYAALILATGGDKTKFPKVAIIAPRGRCGRGALACCRAAGLSEDQIVLWDRKEIGSGGPFVQLVTEVDVLCNCIYLSPEIKTPFVTPELLQRSDRRLTVISDVSCDPGSSNNPLPVYTSSTSFDQPVQSLIAADPSRNILPLDVSSIDHLPSMVPYEASKEFGDKMVPLLLDFANVADNVNWRFARATYDAQVTMLQRTHKLNIVQRYMLDRYLHLDKAAVQDPKSYYPHKFYANYTPLTFRDAFGHLEINASLPKVTASVCGRVTRINSVSRKLIFVDLEWEGNVVQLMWENTSGNDTTADTWWFTKLKQGDVIGAQGYPHRTRRGELSLRVQDFSMLAICVRPLHKLIPKTTTTTSSPSAPSIKGSPSTEKGTTTTVQKKKKKTDDRKYRQRYLHLLRDPKQRNVFAARSRLINTLRKCLQKRGFMEVETPLLNPIAGGANAKPFITYHNALDSKFFMRIAPELYLKMCIVGGFPKVFEIGKNLRNEGMDGTHNPEYTACEFYWALADYNDLITITEALLPELVRSVTGGPLKVKLRGKEIDFSPPYKRLPVVSSLEKAGVEMPADLNNEAGRKQLDAECLRLNVECTAPRTTARLLDALISALLEPQCINPTFITDHPQIMSPLAKWHRTNPQVTERFEMFVNGKEIMNAYTELNDPRLQRDLFAQQEKDATEGDEEAQKTDENFCQALEYALPPTAGWGLGIDRLLMFLLNMDSIKDVILFPTVRPLPTTTTRNVNIALFGSGQCTPVLLAELTRNPEHSVTIFTDQEEQAKALKKRVVHQERRSKVHIQPLVVSDALATTDTFVERLSRFQIAISMVPPFLHPQIAAACIAARVHLLTPSYVSPAMKALDDDARKAGVMLLNELGLDPGLDHLLAVDSIRCIREETKGEAVVCGVRSKCGALPRLDTAMSSPLRYKFGWSTEGVLRAYSRPAKVVRDGKVETITSPYHTRTALSICGLALESVANEDSSNYVDAYFATDTEREHGSIERNTLRLEGTIAIFNMLGDAGFFDGTAPLPPSLTAKPISPLRFSEYCLARSKSATSKALTTLLRNVGLSDDTAALDATGLTALQVTARILGQRYNVNENDRDMTIMHIAIDYYKSSTHQVAKQLSTRTVAFIEYGDAKTTSVSRLVGQCVAAAALAVLNGTISPSAHVGVQRPLDPKLVKSILAAMHPTKNLRSMHTTDEDAW